MGKGRSIMLDKRIVRGKKGDCLCFEPEDRTAKAAEKRQNISPLPLHSSYIADLNCYRVIKDMLRFPSGPHWSEIVKIGNIVETSYDTGPYVVEAISEHETYGVKCITLICSLPNAKRRKDGRMMGDPDGWLNEIVAVNGRLLKLFKANKDEVLVKGEFRFNQNVQVKLL